jgi:hypothetical protein
MDQKSNKDKQVSGIDRRRAAILMIALCLLAITVTAFVYYFTTFQAIYMF